LNHSRISHSNPIREGHTSEKKRNYRKEGSEGGGRKRKKVGVMNVTISRSNFLFSEEVGEGEKIIPHVARERKKGTKRKG